MIERRGAAATARAVEPRHRDAWPGPGSTDVPRRCPTAGLVGPTLEFFHGRDGLPLTGWLYRPRGRSRARSGDAQPARRTGGAGAPDLLPAAPGDGRRRHHRLRARTSAARPASAGPSCTPTTCTAGATPSTTCWPAATSWSSSAIADPERIAVTGRSYGGYLTLATLAFSPGVFAAGVDICGMSDLHTFYRDTEPWIAAAAVSKYGDPEQDYVLLEAHLAAARRGQHRRAAAGRARRAGHQRPDRRGARRSSPRCGRSTGRWSTCSWTARATSTAGPTRAGR